MSIGGQVNSSMIDAKLSSISVAMRDLMQQIKNLSTWINGQSTGLATLESLGYSASDAQLVLNMVSYLNTLAGVYFGTANQATNFNFDNQLSQIWAGQ